MWWSYFKVYCIVRPQSLFTFASSLKAKCVSTNSVCTPSVQKIKSVNEIFIITNVMSHTYWANGYTVVLTDRQIEYWARRMQKLNVFIFFFFVCFFHFYWETAIVSSSSSSRNLRSSHGRLRWDQPHLSCLASPHLWNLDPDRAQSVANPVM